MSTGLGSTQRRILALARLQAAEHSEEPERWWFRILDAAPADNVGAWQRAASRIYGIEYRRGRVRLDPKTCTPASLRAWAKMWRNMGSYLDSA